MKAIIYTKYGSPNVLRLEEVEKPAPKDGEVLVNVQAAALNAADWRLMRGKPFFVRMMTGFFKPKNRILGADIAGRVEAVGKNVKRFQPGDDVFGDISDCGWGGLAHYVSTCEDALVKKPDNLSFPEAAAVPLTAVAALQGLRDHGRIREGQKVLINGASGGVGTFAVQIAKSFGTEVTGVCSTGKMEMVRQLGADHVIDYTREDFTKNGRHYDLILAISGYHPISDYQRALSPRGIYVMTGGTGAQMFQAMILGPLKSKKGGKKMCGYMAKPNRNDLEFVKKLIETGKVAPVIDKRYPLDRVPEAIKYLEDGHATGKAVITIEPEL